MKINIKLTKEEIQFINNIRLKLNSIFKLKNTYIIGNYKLFKMYSIKWYTLYYICKYECPNFKFNKIIYCILGYRIKKIK